MERRVDISFLLHLVGILAPGLWLGRALRIPLPAHIGLTFPDLRDEPRGGSRHPDLGRDARPPARLPACNDLVLGRHCGRPWVACEARRSLIVRAPCQ